MSLRNSNRLKTKVNNSKAITENGLADLENQARETNVKKRAAFTNITNASINNAPPLKRSRDDTGCDTADCKIKTKIKKEEVSLAGKKKDENEHPILKQKCLEKQQKHDQPKSNGDVKVTIKTESSDIDSDFHTKIIDDKVEKNKSIPLPEGVKDFDKECAHDPFAEPEYVMDIFKYYRERESLFPIKKYIENQPELSKGMRAILVDWMVEVQESFELNHETFYLAVKLVDMYLMHNVVAKDSLQLVGATALFIACKFDERSPPLTDDFLYICDEAYTKRELLTMEMKMLRAVDFNLGIPLSYRFLRRYARSAHLPMEILTLARYILELSLMEYDMLEYTSSLMAAASLSLALQMKKENKWSATLEYYSGYKEQELADIVKQLNNILLMPNKCLQTIRKKYSHSVFFEVAKIQPLKMDSVA